MRSLVFKTDQWLTRILNYPGIDKNTLIQKKIYWISSLSVTIMIFLLTVIYHLIFPDLRIIIYYGLFLTAIYAQGVIIPPFVRNFSIRYQFINSILVSIATFICILKLGGIPNSGGLIFVGLAMVFFTLNFKKRAHSIGIFLMYIVSIVAAGFLHPYLTVPPEMTPAVNVSLFVVNLLWISGFAIVFVLSFISQRVKLEQMETQRIKELDDARTKLYTNITHEFRTPLTIITGMTHLIREDPEKWLDEGSDKIDKNAAILLNLVNQMLDLARLESGTMSLRLIRADAGLYIGYVVGLFRSLAETAGIELTYLMNTKDAIMDYDPDKLLQIVSNLLSNALKYTQAGGSVKVTTGIGETNKFEIRVADNGPGIPEDYLPFIFDRFSRGESEHVRLVSGSGLGLALTREIVKLLDGTITVESKCGSGTEVIVILPVTLNAPLQDKQDLSELNPGKPSLILYPKKKRDFPTPEIIDSEKPLILIVEDNDDLVQYLMTLLEKDYIIMISDNGSDALKKAYENIPDIILTDLMMPVMDGIALLDEVKNDQRTSHVPVVILTAKADIISRVEGLRKGADAYISKPFDRNELQVQLRTLIAQRKKLQERYSVIGNLVLNEEHGYKAEDTFIKRIRQIMDEKLADEDFDIHRLCLEAGMSRTQLYRKFRQLTDRTPNDYLLAFRLYKAKDLLTGSDISVADAAYKTGFRNISHFSRVFKKEFGFNPSEARHQSFNLLL